jgi:hypothetical protein
LLLLDPHGDAIVPPGYTLVASEVEWLRETIIADTSVPQIVVRGQILTQWARTWWETQGGQCDDLVSPGYMLQSLVSTLPTADAQAVAQELHACWGENSWPAPLTLSAVLNALYPGVQQLWDYTPSAEPNDIARVAGDWLAWLHETERTDWPATHLPLLAAWAGAWQKEEPQAKTLFPLDPITAHALFRAWVGLSPTVVPRPLRQTLKWAGPCPVPVPADWLAATRLLWETDLPRYVANRPVETEAGTAVAAWWSQVTSQHLHADLLPIALHVAMQYVQHHRAALTAELLRSLRSSMDAEDYAKLARRIPPPEPGPLPTEPEAVLRWVTDSYLPYRIWQSELEPPDEAAMITVRRHALAFGSWLLATYPARLSGATHPYQHLYWSQASSVAPQNSNEVVLWIIADGLGWTDARYLAQKIREESGNRLTTTEAAPCFGLLPTITHFTKIPVRAGSTYQRTLARASELVSESAADVGRHQDPVRRAAELTGGQMLVWKPKEPDTTYHETAEASVVRRNALGALDTMAKTIVAAAQGISKALTLRVLLTTDHGRMLGTGARAIPVPDGFEAHGRVAYQEVPGPAPEPSPDIEWLDPTYFKLPGWAGVVRDERSFLKVRKDTGSQSGGPDNFSHGGIWPEEVVVPFLTLQRNAVPVKVSGTAAGRARASSTGTISLELFNEADRSVRLRRLNLNWSTGSPLEADITAALPGQQKTLVTVPLTHWPDGQRAGTATITVTVELPDGSEQQFSLTNALSTDEFQTRQVDLLGDL